MRIIGATLRAILLIGDARMALSDAADVQGLIAKNKNNVCW